MKNKYIATVTVVIDDTQAGFVIFGKDNAEADSTFRFFYPGFTDADKFSYTIALEG